MAVKKSQLYASLWQSCDELRGGMDASQYKDYVLVLLFIKYVSDKYANQLFAPVTIPEGASFADMVALKGKPDIGDQINKHIVQPLAHANKLSDMPDFNDATKLGKGKEMVERLTNLIAIFENPALDFSTNQADGDDILGDAYEYLMRHFATESGKSKGQFYTPSEVSRVLAQVVGIEHADTTASTTVYDPTCGSGSLLLKVGSAAGTKVTLFGQEKDAATSGLARMNMFLHDFPTATITQGNTLSSPAYASGTALKTFDYVVANPPFSDKRWSTGLDPLADVYERFSAYGAPPTKQGDYAYLLHIVRSLKSTGTGAIILPHGVLFRGNAEAEIRKKLLRAGLIKAIIGLPANLFYGTGIPACIVVLDKKNAAGRKSVFLMDASAGFIKDGPKNRLRDRDIHHIVDVFTAQRDVPGYARTVPLSEIESNDFNLNLPRYIDNQQSEDEQDLSGHIHGGIPERDVNALHAYWDVCPSLRSALFHDNRPGYLDLVPNLRDIKATIAEHPEFTGFQADMAAHFEAWRAQVRPVLAGMDANTRPKALIHTLADGLLEHYTGKPLVDSYSVYQHLMDLWASTWQDDAYLIVQDGWVATPERTFKTVRGKKKDTGWVCELVPKDLMVARYGKDEQAAIDALTAKIDAAKAARTELQDEHSGDDDVFSELDSINAANVKRHLKVLKKEGGDKADIQILAKWVRLYDSEAKLKKQRKADEAALDARMYGLYSTLTEDDVRQLVVDDKWLAALKQRIEAEMDRVSQRLTRRVSELAERYETPMSELEAQVAALTAKVGGHLQRMGVA